MNIANAVLLAEFRAGMKCELCGTPTPQGTDPHHLLSRGAGRVDIRANLASLERCCHMEVHAKDQLAAELKQIVAKREGVPWEAIEEAVWWFRKLPKGSFDPGTARPSIKLPEGAAGVVVRKALEEMQVEA